MNEFLASAEFRYGVFPILSIGLGVWVKYVSRNDRYAVFKKEDLAVGLELILSAWLIFIILTADRARSLVTTLQATTVDSTKAAALSNKLAMAGWINLALLLALWGISTLVRKLGWSSETELRPVLGIALPLVMGALALLAVMAEATQ